MIKRIFAVAGIILLFSCSNKEQFPQFKSEKVDLNQVRLPEDFQFQTRDSVINAVQTEITNEALNRLAEFQLQ